MGFYTIVSERRCRVYVLFGKVLAVLDEPGLHILPTKLGRRAFIVNWLGKCHVLDMRLDQEYLRSQAVNSEEGAPVFGAWAGPGSGVFHFTDRRIQARCTALWVNVVKHGNARSSFCFSRN